MSIKEVNWALSFLADLLLGIGIPACGRRPLRPCVDQVGDAPGCISIACLIISYLVGVTSPLAV